MLDEILNDDEFAVIMKRHIYECIECLLSKDIHATVVANLSLVKFEPELPEEIMRELLKRPFVVFALAGYTFESTILSRDVLSFEAGFGSENFASVVSVPLGAIVQIAVEENPILVNFATFKPQKQTNKLEKSISKFKANPNNKSIIKY